MSRRLRLLAGAALALPATLLAQGSVSSQGFGYPTGQLTTRALGTGGAMAEFDPAAPINPAATGNWGVMGAYAQYAPERRTTTVGGSRASTFLPRFPVFSFGIPIGERLAFGVSASTLLERNFVTQVTGLQPVRDDTVSVVTTNEVRGNMSDLRFSAAYTVRPWLKVGAAYHVIGGENRIRVQRVFNRRGTTVVDSTLSTVNENSDLGFDGGAWSVGLDVRPLPNLFVAASVRQGLSLESRVGSFVPSRADVPDRMGLAVRYDGLGGTRLAARWERTSWSQLQSLGSGGSRAFDTREFGGGVELNGPSIQRIPTDLRLGYRQRTLPFGVNGVQPEERGLGGGVALPFARGRFIAEVAVERLSRTVPGLANVSESGWTTAVSFRLRP